MQAQDRHTQKKTILFASAPAKEWEIERRANDERSKLKNIKHFLSLAVRIYSERTTQQQQQKRKQQNESEVYTREFVSLQLVKEWK